MRWLMVAVGLALAGCAAPGPTPQELRADADRAARIAQIEAMQRDAAEQAVERARAEEERRRQIEVARREQQRRNEEQRLAAAQRRQQDERVQAERERRLQTEFQDGYGRWWPREQVQWWAPQGRVDCTPAPNPDRYAEWFRNHLEHSPFGSIPRGSTVRIVQRGGLTSAGRPGGEYADIEIVMAAHNEHMAILPARLRTVPVSLTTSYSACRSLLVQNHMRIEADWRDWEMSRRR